MMPSSLGAEEDLAKRGVAEEEFVEIVSNGIRKKRKEVDGVTGDGLFMFLDWI